ncbi:DNA-binding protein HEXBP-like [Ooceraea biroi]|uniref:DNA-binding protein HEXBP-like n=1 Tax=Ooceraea biroi TaxID=2015173 RepID=UPI000F076086|nr:DNA-binding protein HEXBP-like [Ooceraea biroi]
MVRGLEDSISAIATAGGCSPTSVETGPHKTAPDGLGRVWVRCPAIAALKVAKQARIRIGWTRVGVVLLEPRPLQCYKCLEVGHVQQRCPNQANRGDRCYHCGGTGHRARDCPAEAPHCSLCADLGKLAGHRLSGPACARNNSGRKKKGGRAAVEGSGTPSAPVTPTP